MNSSDMASVRRKILDDGVAHIPAVVDRRTCAELQDAIEHCRQHTGPHFRRLSAADEPVVESELFRWSDTLAFHDIATAGPLPTIAGEVFGGEAVVLLEDQWFYSAAGSNTPSPWHQDQPYHPLEPWFLTIWVPLDPVPEGCGLKAVKRSHQGPIYSPVEFSANDATLDSGAMTLEPVPAIDQHPDCFDIVLPNSVPGDAVLLDSRTLHAAGGFCASQFRRLSIRYAPIETVYASRPWPVATFWAEHDVEAQLGSSIVSKTFPIIKI
ncbi:MAG: phytanoyl-CoA dioxygenase family protein [Pseudomonadota bacterium]